MKQQITEIINHDIKWHVNVKNIALSDADIDYIESMIQGGYTSGELNVSYGENNEKSASGWWQIINWKDVSLELYNSITNTNKEAQKQAQAKAVKAFEDNWLY